ncbi:hypothetical protein IAQ61_011296 [Plenodomus lingam]|uniref:Hsp70 family protein n=1 Tax=Leptosphaeria maculans (strain JN3 / isolate v23.1.3 / race Av1-4-5-6-7-8) TaxID=985895 RepID=E5A9M3_LEPMJ|nr:hypothetical protein LEMA_P014940.1 [Plenodomus lingam JN3]KAH9859515.1 hypothetical protein IAQ61_011296 [Plenodomus lingam]CBY00364.1 hypothetical protein LEMA_P014940.1 [Plenodomus lingam JN3]
MASARSTGPLGKTQKTRARLGEEPSLDSQRPLKRTSTARYHQVHSYDYSISIDFGTTFTSVACSIRGGAPFTLQEFPDDPQPGRVNMQVPTEILYLSSESEGSTGVTHKRIYGYQIQERRNHPSVYEDGLTEAGHIVNVKLLLDKTVHLKSLQKKLNETLGELKLQHIISKNEDVIRHLLELYLQHAKYIMVRDYGLKSCSTVEVTFCVPVCWDPSANEIMSACVQAALRKVDLGIGPQNQCNLFMVNEAEAAAMHTLSGHVGKYHLGESFLLLDCGGGTIDLGVYEIGRDFPFRLGRQVNPTSGAVCGSGDLNRAFSEFATSLLKHATISAAGDDTIEHIVETEVLPQFENWTKRSFSLNHRDLENKSYAFRIRGLQAIPGDDRIKKGTFVLSFDDMEALFAPSLKTIATLMRNQIFYAIEARTKVNKVVLVGGFGDSPALKEYLGNTLDQINAEYGTSITIITAPQNTAAAGVALGALKRALDKTNGPAKIPCQSIGIYHHLRYEPDRYSKDVLNQHEDYWEMCEEDGEEYISNTIQWIIKKGQGAAQSVHEYGWESMHIFTPAHTTQWIAEYELFASDECTEDYYIRNHPKNRGKVHKIGKVVFDLMPIRPYLQLLKANGADEGQDRYEPTIKIKMKIIDKHLDFVAYYPAEGHPQITIQGVHEHFSVISWFEPGTV